VRGFGFGFGFARRVVTGIVEAVAAVLFDDGTGFDDVTPWTDE
jgi:hypothetical protein